MSRSWPTLPPLPNPLTPVLDAASGTLSRDWYLYWTAADKILRGTTSLALNDIADIDAASPSDGDVLTFVAADSKWKGV